MHKLWAIVLLSFPSWAQTTWVVNPDHSEILFKTTYLNETDVNGRFKKFHGQVEFDEEQKPRKLGLVIEVESIDTGHTIRDGHLKANDFLRAKTFPTINFASEKIQPLKGDHFRAEGLLQMRGETRPYAIDFELRNAVNDTWGHPSRFAKFNARLKRSDFGVTWNKTLENNLLMLGNVVHIWGTLQVQDRKDITPGPKHLIPDTAFIREREKIHRGEAVAISPEQAPSTGIVSSSPASNDSATGAVVAAGEYSAPGPKAKTLWWWLSFSYVGLIGFLGIVAGMIYVKRELLIRYPDAYQEIGWMGFLTDAIGIGLFFIYSLAVWEIGWT